MSKDRLRAEINSLQESLDYLTKSIGGLDISPGIKAGLEATIANVKTTITQLEECATDDIGLPLKSNPPVSNPNVIEFAEFTLYPSTRDIVCKDGLTGRLAKFDFGLLLEMALHNGKPVVFKPTASLLTHISKLRREFPVLKDLIKTNRDRKGSYYLMATPKR